jgi:hypothetical protein
MESLSTRKNDISRPRNRSFPTRFSGLVGTLVDMATPGMDTQPSSPRTELDLITEQELARHLKICRRQLYNWRVGGLIPYFKMGKSACGCCRRVSRVKP